MDNKITASVLALALSVPVLSAQETNTVPAPAAAPAQQAPALEPLAVDPQIRSGVLENGLRYIIRPTKEPAGHATVRLFVNVGSLDETEETKGVSHFIEHLVFNGSRTFKRGELIPAMQRLGLGLGGDANAYTSFLQTVFMLDLPKLDEETVKFALTILRDFADGATLDDDAIDHERGIVISELKSGDSEALRAQLKVMRMMTPGTRLADSLPIGREEVIANIPGEKVREYCRNHYVPGNMTVIVTGDVSYETAESWVRQYFSDMEARTPEPRPDLGTPDNLGPVEIVANSGDQANLSLAMAVISPHEEKADTIEQRIEELPLNLAMAMLNNRFSRLSRVPESPFLGAGLDKSPLMKISDIFALSVSTRPENWQSALAQVERELRNAIEFGFSEREMNEAVSTFVNALQQATVSWVSTTASQMADRITECLAEGNALTAPDEDLRSMMLALQRIAADPDVCRRALAKEYDASRVKLAATGAIPEGLTEESLRALYNRAHALPTVKPLDEDTAPFAYDTIGEPGKVVEQGRHEDLDVTTLTLSNGIRVNLKHTQSQKGVIRMVATVDGGTLRMPAVPGLDMMVSAMMQAGGLEAHTPDDLQRLFAGKQVGVSFGQDADRFSFSGTTGTRDFELQCKLMAASIMHPGYRKDGESQLRRNLPAFFRRMESTPDGAFQSQAARILYGGDARFTVPTPEQMEALNTETARAAVEPFLKDGAMEVTIVGDFDKESVIPVLERTFGAMPQRRTEYTPIDEAVRNVAMCKDGGEHFLRYPSEVDRTIVTQVYLAGDGRDRKRNMRMQVLASIVQEKLFDTLRAELGQAYSPSVIYTANEEMNGAAIVSCMSNGVKANRELVDKAMQAVCEEIGKGSITEDAFQCSLRPIVSSLQKTMRSNGFWLSNLSNTQAKPDKLERLRTRLQDVKGITCEEVRQLGIEVFGQGNALHFFTVPAE